ncbi:MAG: retropepsin-like aspartic protease [Candidatus Thiodiazotropha sp.]
MPESEIRINEYDAKDSASESSDDDLGFDTICEGLSTEDSITVQQLRSVSMFRVPILVQGVQTAAVVHTAAEVTIISDKLYNSLQEKPKIMKEVVMNTAGRDLKMKAHIVFPIKLELGTRTYEEQIYVAPIEDDMLLGIDFLEKHKADIDICERQLKLDGITLPMQLSSDGKPPKVARVILNKRTVVPPNSVVKVKGFTEMGDQPYTIEPDHESKVLIPRTLYDGGSEPVICLVNVTERNVLIKRNQSIALATEVDVLPQKTQVPEVDIMKVNQTQENDELSVPEHLQELFDKSSRLLLENEKCQLATLLTEFEDVFAKNDYD